VDRRETFSSDDDRRTYLRLVARNLPEAGVRLLAWCLMTNHVHLIAVPERDDSLAVLLRRVHGCYSQYYNACHDRSGHLWQNRYFACALGRSRLWIAMTYVERNPVRAGLAQCAEQYLWSSAAAHVQGRDDSRLLDMDWWHQEHGSEGWAEALSGDQPERDRELAQCTFAGKPFGEAEFVARMADRFGRRWKSGRPKKAETATAAARPGGLPAEQAALFGV
jgi:putative transposase